MSKAFAKDFEGIRLQTTRVQRSKSRSRSRTPVYIRRALESDDDDVDGRASEAAALLVQVDDSSRGSYVVPNYESSRSPTPLDVAAVSSTRDGIQMSRSASGNVVQCVCVNDNCTTDESHCHTTEPEPNFDKTAYNKLRIAVVLVLLFMIAELAGGIISGSLAIMTDAAHMLADLASYSISLFAMWISKRRPTKKMSFGYHRAEIVGAIVSILIIWLLTGILVYEGIRRIIHKEIDIDADVMLIIAGLGVAINIIMGCVLKPPHGHGHSHSHGSSHSHSHSEEGHGHGHGHGHAHAHVNKPENLNVRAAFVHVLGDFFFSVGVLIAAYIIKYKPDWSIVDPICTFVFSVIVLGTTVTVIRDAMHVLMEGVPRQLDFDNIQEDLRGLYGVEAVHDMHIWSLTTDKTALSVHLAIDPTFHSQDVLCAAQDVLKKKYKIFKVTVQVEMYQNTMKNCTRCKGPNE